MKEQALQIVSEVEQEYNKLNYLREYLQHVILRNMFEQDWLKELIYHGGTALRMLYDLPRFSEDIDFHLVKPEINYNTEDKVEILLKSLKKSGYNMDVKPGYEGNVKKFLLKFKDLLYEAKISPHKQQKLNIKIEIDVNPPGGFNTELQTIDKYFPFVLSHHDKASFLAGKLHAAFQRSWMKGRDIFDLNFFVNRWSDITPNLKYLKNALNQTGYRGEEVTDKNWKKITIKHIKKLDWNAVEQDVTPFIQRGGDLKAFKKELIIKKLSENE